MDASPPPPRRGSKALANLKRLALLVVILVGLLGAWQIYQTTFARQTFTVAVDIEKDVTGLGNEMVVTTEELFGLMTFELAIEPRDEPLLSLDLTRERMGVFGTVGKVERTEVLQGRMNASLRLRDADPGRPRVALEPQLTDRHLGFVLRHADADEFLARPVETVVAIRNQRGTPVGGLTDRYGEVTEGDRGVYTARAALDDILSGVLRGDPDLQIPLEKDGASFQISVPLTWFLRAGEEAQVVEIEEQESDFQVRRVSPERSRPRQVAVDIGWSGEFKVLGNDMALALSAVLQGPRRVRCEIVGRSRTALDLQLDPTALETGTYDLELDDGGGTTVLLRQALVVQPGFAILEPANGAAIPQGDPIPLRWRAPGQDELWIEVSRHDQPGTWQTLFRGPADQGQATGDSEGLATGDYTLRIRIDARPDLPERSRRIIIEDPPLYEVRFRFQNNGTPFGRVKDLLVDGEVVDSGHDPMLIRIELTPGIHQVAATATLLPTFQQTIEVTHPGQEFVFDFGK